MSTRDTNRHLPSISAIIRKGWRLEADGAGAGATTVVERDDGGVGIMSAKPTLTPSLHVRFSYDLLVPFHSKRIDHLEHRRQMKRLLRFFVLLLVMNGLDMIFSSSFILK